MANTTGHGCAQNGRTYDQSPMTGTPTGNVRLRAARERRGLTSQADFVDAVIATAHTLGLGELTLSTRTARRWEAATPPWPHRQHQAALEALFGCNIQELGFTPRRPTIDTAWHPTGTAPGAEPPPPPTDRLPEPLRALRDTLTDPVITDYATLTSSYRRLYTALPAVALAAPAAAHAALGAQLLPAASAAQHTELAAAVCDAWLLTGRIQLFDTDQTAAARTSLQHALHAARQARDDARGAAVLAYLALAAAVDHPGDLATARDHLRMAHTFATRAGEQPLLLAWVDAAEADIELRLGDPARAATLISHAEHLHKAADGPEWLDWLPAHRLAGIKADILLALGRLTDAVSVLQRNAREAATPKLRAIAYSDLAAVAAAQADPATACAMLSAALDALDDRWYDSVGTRINHVRAQLDPWNTDPQVTALDQRLYTWQHPALDGAHP
jgi:hypothetical protein